MSFIQHLFEAEMPDYCDYKLYGADDFDKLMEDWLLVMLYYHWKEQGNA